ncbi:hypothetical protein E2F43_18890 [Seongchinamella unica]|uniref:Uncharacterized protein n=1 Tax=Seongchinamella unica TaxID=2547392 RepID=A0A4R5LML9_9GAMM|nr:hypothetical protein [Seongchinamella unica]TDG11263.1 hypothetical protein E2F43_18890 [Seongchinamella unica]
MNWEAIAAIGEMVGAVGVIATLGFLAFQVRQNSSLLKNNTRQLEQNHQVAIAQAMATSDRQSDPMLIVAQSNELSRIFYKGLANYVELDPESKMRFSLAMGPIIAGVSVKFMEQIKLEIADADYLPDQANFLMKFLDTVGGRQWWKTNMQMYPKPFVQMVEDVLNKREVKNKAV